MKKSTLPNLFRMCMQTLLLLAISLFSLGPDSAKAASTDATANPEACGQLLQNVEAAFRAALAPDGSVPASPETAAAAREYIRVSKLCYDEIQAANSTGTFQNDTPIFIDEGGVQLSSPSSAEFVLTGQKWASGTDGTTITYSFMGNGISFKSEGYGSSVALTSLPDFQTCFITGIQNAFAAWQAVANIHFVQVNDSGAAFDAPGATGDIRIGAHAFDGLSGTLAHAYFPPPNGNSAAGDLHFDSAERWTCNTSNGIDIGVVALHEIGHSLGLNHEMTSTVALMDPYYNPNLTVLQSDDINGIRAIYAAAALTAAAPSNDNFASAKTIGSVPYADTLDTTGAANSGDGPAGPILCQNNNLNKGFKNVWYRYTPSTNTLVYADSFGSTPPPGVSQYDTYIAVWTLSNSVFTLVACNDDDPTLRGLQSQVAFSAQAGTPYYIEVAQYAGEVGSTTPPSPSGGLLQFHVTSFQDAPGDFWAWRYIEGLYKAGVTAGCNGAPRQFCPASIVSRDQMAVFLLKAKHGAGYVPPAVGSSTGFNDVPPTYWAAAWIKQLAAEGVTSGCGGGNYCPTAAVSRDQMAVFLLRAKYGAGYVPPAVGSSTGFNDVLITYWAAAWIKQLAAEGITSGCGGGNYCPTAAVSRDQMAVFLDRTFAIAPLP
jgi:hypothetical protein